jgi:hypothetical protein
VVAGSKGHLHSVCVRRQHLLPGVAGRGNLRRAAHHEGLQIWQAVVSGQVPTLFALWHLPRMPNRGCSEQCCRTAAHMSTLGVVQVTEAAVLLPHQLLPAGHPGVVAGGTCLSAAKFQQRWQRA